MSSVQLFSFDVFDTLITRPYARPRDLFRTLAIDVLGADASLSEFDGFALERVSAESRARSVKGNRDDITLAEIYEVFEKSSKFGQWTRVAMEREIHLEFQSVVPIRSSIDSVQRLMAEGRRVIFLSDMYLPTRVIADMLRRVGIILETDRLYVSGEIGLSKHTGRLFDYVSSREKVEPKDCFHTGDNWKSDVLRPRQRGWQAALFSESTLNRFEVPNKRGSCYLTTRMSGVSRASRLHQVSGNPEISGLVANVIGPFLTSFTSHVLLDAQKRGLDTLYFVSRDGQVFFKIANALQATGLASEVECRYLYGSRQAWLLPSVIEARRDQIEWAFRKGVSSAPRDILRRLDIDPSEVSNFLNDLGLSCQRLDRGQSENQVNFFVERLLSSASDLIAERASGRRKVLMKYLGEQGILDWDRHYALVDVGWTLQSQAALKRSLVAEGYAANIRGYYLGVGEWHVPLEIAGEVSAFIRHRKSNVSSRLEANWIFHLSTILLIEHFFTLADHPSLAHYVESKGDVVPVFKPDHRDDQLTAFIEAFHQELVAYAGFAAKVFGKDLASDQFIHWSVENVRRFVCEPHAKDVYPIAWLPANREITHDLKHTARLASPLKIWDIIKMASHDLFSPRDDYFSANYAWHEGAMAISPIHVRGAYRALRFLGRKFKELRQLAKGNVHKR